MSHMNYLSWTQKHFFNFNLIIINLDDFLLWHISRFSPFQAKKWANLSHFRKSDFDD